MTDNIYNQDCIKGMQIHLAKESVQLCVTDPPFNIDYDYGEHYKDNLTAAQYLDWSGAWMAEIYRVLVPHGTFWLAIGDAFVSEMDVLAKKLGFFKRSHVVWYYTFGVNCINKLTPSHTHLLYYTKHKEHFTFLPDSIKVKSAREAVYNDPRAKKGGRIPDDTWFLRPQEVPGGFDAKTDTWHVPRVAGTFKQRIPDAPTQMPEQLLGRIIRACSNQADWVLDSFAGMGSTLTVAKKLRRQYIGFELSAEYTEICRSRLNRAFPDAPLEGNVPQGG